MPHNESTTKSISSVAELLGKLAGLIFGLSALAYFIGYRIEAHYLSEAGAIWALPLFAPADFIREGQGVIFAIAVTFFFSIPSLMDAEITAEKLRRKDIVLNVVAMGLLVGAYITSKYGDNNELDYSLSVIAGLVWAAGAGFTVGELVGRLNESRHKWQGYHVRLIWFFYISALAAAPYFIGTNKAKLDLKPRTSSLPIAAIGDSDSEWRVLRVLGDRYLVVKLSEDPLGRRFRVIDVSSEVQILSGRGKSR